jgi:hypothetical protein
MKKQSNFKFISKLIAVIIVTTTFLSLISVPAKASPNIITPVQKDEEQIKHAVASNPTVIKKWALLAHYLGFGWCAGTASQTVGEDFSVNRTQNGDYEIIANYRPGDPYTEGEKATQRLKITLSDFRVAFNSEDFQMEPAVISNSGERVASTYVASNEGQQSTNFSKEYSYSTSGEVTHETNTTFGVSIGLSTTVSAECAFGGVEATLSTEFTSEHGWSDSSTRTTGDTITDTFQADIPAHTKRAIEQMANDVQSVINYKVNARILYSVKFEGFLRWSGNARLDHPGNRPTVALKLGNATTSAAEYIYDLYTHRNIQGYNQWIDWNYLENQSDMRYLVEYSLYNSPEVSLVEGKFTYKGISTSMRAGEPVPLYPLQKVTAAGDISPMFVGDNVDLKKCLSLTGLDSKSTPYYNFDAMPVTWSIASGNSFAEISGNILTAKAQGSGTITATVGGIKSNPINFSIKNLPSLNDLYLSGSIGDMYIGDSASGSFDLSFLALISKDQYGNAFNTSNQPIIWKVSGEGNASVSGGKLVATKPGQCFVTATINGVTSNPVSFTVNAQKEIKTLTLSGNIQGMFSGDTYPISNLTLIGKDQYGFPVDLNKLAVKWSTGSGSYAKISNDGLNVEAVAVGLDSIKAQIGNVTSNSLFFRIQKKPYLKTVILTGTIPTLYIGETGKDVYDLGNIVIDAKDQYNNDFNISGKNLTWKISSGPDKAIIDSGYIKGVKEGTGTLTAMVDGVESSPVVFETKNPLILRRLDLNGIIPILTLGDNFNLSQLNLRGVDQYGDPMDLSNNKVNWSIPTGKNSGSISGSFLTADGEGFGTVTATVYSIDNKPVTSNPLVFSVKSPSVLKSVVVTGTLPPQTTNGSFDLLKLSVNGFDQYGNPYDISAFPIEWKITKGSYNASIAGKILYYNSEGNAVLCASIIGIDSNSISLSIMDPLTLKKLSAEKTIPILEPGSVFDLSKLNITGKDQYGNDFDISGENIVFTVTSGEKYATVFGKYLTISSDENKIPVSGTLVASVKGTLSDPIPFKVQKGGAIISPTPSPVPSNNNTSSPSTTTTSASVKSSDASLRSLEVEGNTLSPLFKPDILLYTTNVENLVENLKLTYETSEPHAMVKITGADNLKNGQNTVTITVTAQDNTVKTYSIVVNKALAELPDNKEQDTKPVTEPDNKIPSAIDFTDLNDHWSEKYIMDLAQSGVLAGYTDGTVKPDAEITRAELAVILVKALGLKPSEQISSKFTDASNIPDWAKGYVETAAQNGIILGYQDKTFKPGKVCIRQEMLAMIMRAFKLGESSEDIRFKDKNTIHDYAKRFVSKAAALKIIVGFPDNTFKPLKNITRSEAAALVDKSMSLIKK